MSPEGEPRQGTEGPGVEKRLNGAKRGIGADRGRPFAIGASTRADTGQNSSFGVYASHRPSGHPFRFFCLDTLPLNGASSCLPSQSLRP
jgi:hypothetical protein